MESVDDPLYDVDFDLSNYVDGVTDEEQCPDDQVASQQCNRDEQGSEPNGEFVEEQASRRREQKRRSKKKAMERARAALSAERRAAASWKPRRCVEIAPTTGMELSARWKCDHMCRAHTAFIGVQKGVNVHQTAVRFVSTCRDTSCAATMQFDRQPRSGNWKLNKMVDHSNECLGQRTDGQVQTNAAQFCAPAYTANQVARAIISDTDNDPAITTRTVQALVLAKGIYNRQPSPAHYRAVRLELQRRFYANRAVDMAAMAGYRTLLENSGHTVRLVTLNGDEMKKTRLKAARHIHDQSKKCRSIPIDAQFNPDTVDVADICDEGLYYGGFVFTPSIASHMCKEGRLTMAADAAHCEGVGPQSYGTTFEVVGYDTNNHLIPLVFGHSVGPECYEFWKIIFDACAAIDGFDIAQRTTIVDQEKGIAKAYREAVKNSKLFMDPLHVKKNLASKLGAHKNAGIDLYEQAVRAPTVEGVDSIRRHYTDSALAYLGRIPDSELYRAYSILTDLTITSQGAESQMSAALRNKIRSVEPQAMLSHVVLTQRNSFLRKQAAAAACKRPVPPYVEKHLASLLQRARVYQSTVRFIDGTSQMEATVRSFTDGSVCRRVVLSRTPQTVPECCAYSKDDSGFPCLHGVAVLAEKYGATNLHRFVHSRHLTKQWKLQYNGVSFPLPIQSDIDAVFTTAKTLVSTGNCIEVPKAIPPPRGRPTKNTGKRKKGWFEQGPSVQKKRSYTCSLCRLEGHTTAECNLRQLFED